MPTTPSTNKVSEATRQKVPLASSRLERTMPLWTWLIPVLSLALLVAAVVAGVGTWLAVLCGAALVGAVLVAVHHAEVVAHRLGEPLGTLVLALAVTAIETALILSMMLAGGEEMAVLPRDAIYAAVMIICNGVVGICVLLGGLAHREQTFRVEGAGAGLAALIVMSTLTLVLPVFTTSTPAGTYSSTQLAFVAVTSAALWADFIFIQTVRHRDYFTPVTDAANPNVHAEPPTTWKAWMSFGLLFLSLVAVVGLAKMLSPSIEDAVEAANAPRAVVGIVIATLVLLPETWAAVRAARADRLQSSMNSCYRLCACMHWSHRSRCGAGIDRSPATPSLGPAAQGHGIARADVPGQRCHSRHRSHLHDAGGSPSGGLCGIPVSRARALNSELLWNRATEEGAGGRTRQAEGGLSQGRASKRGDCGTGERRPVRINPAASVPRLGGRRLPHLGDPEGTSKDLWK